MQSLKKSLHNTYVSKLTEQKSRAAEILPVHDQNSKFSENSCYMFRRHALDSSNDVQTRNRHPPLLPSLFGGWYLVYIYLVLPGRYHPPSQSNFLFIQIFRSFWLAPILRLILHNQLTLTIFGRCGQYTIDSMVYLIENEYAWTIVN